MSLRCDGIGNSNSIQKTAFNFNNVCRLCMSRGKPLVPIFDEEGMLSIRIMSLVPLVKVGYYCISVNYFLFVSTTGYRKYVKKKSVVAKYVRKEKEFEVSQRLLRRVVLQDKIACSPMKMNWCLGGTCCRHLQGWIICQAGNQDRPGPQRRTKRTASTVAVCFILVSCLQYYLPQQMEVTCPCQTFVDFQWNTRCYIPGERIRFVKM